MTTYSPAQYTGDGSQKAFAIPFPYLNRSDVNVMVGGVVVSQFSWTSASLITFDNAPAIGAVISISRKTKVDTPISTFTSGPISATSLRRALLQSLYLFQELLIAAPTVSAVLVNPVINGKLTLGGNLYSYFPTPNYVGDITNAQVIGVLGTVAAPVTTPDAVAVFQKVSNKTTAGLDVASYTSIKKVTAAAGSNVTGSFAEAVDTAGGVTSFVEGGRVHGLVFGGGHGSAYGFVSTAMAAAPATSVDYLVGVEGVILNTIGSDAATFASFNRDAFWASFCATNWGPKKADAGFVTNPYNGAPFRTGLYIGAASVDDTAIAVAASLVNGLDLTKGSFSNAAIHLPNMGLIRARNGANTGSDNILYYDNLNQMHLGTNAVVILADTVFYALNKMIFGAGLQYRNKSVAVPTSGSTVNLSATVPRTILNPAASLGALTLNLPASPLDGDTVIVSATKAITTLTWTGGTNAGLPTTLPASGVISVVYDGATSTWLPTA